MKNYGISYLFMMALGTGCAKTVVLSAKQAAARNDTDWVVREPSVVSTPAVIEEEPRPVDTAGHKKKGKR
jgi:hypothetical protein